MFAQGIKQKTESQAQKQVLLIAYNQFGYIATGVLFLVTALLTTTTYRSQTTETRNHTGDGEILSGNPPDVLYGSQYFELVIPEKKTAGEEAPSANVEETVPLTEKQNSDDCGRG